MTEADISELRIENLDHLGIVAGICDRIGLVELLDERLGTSPDELISSGQVVKAMILNGLGFVSAPMYLFSRFFEGKPTEHLLGEGIKPEHLNDDKIARVLEKLFDCGLTSLFVEISLRAASREGVGTDRLHLDATSLSVHGRYGQAESENQEEEEEPKPIHLTYGYSRDHRPDLKQFLVDLMVSGDGGVPLFLRVADGNESDAAVFAKLIGDYRAQSDFEALFVADAALYNEENIKRLGTQMNYVSRVPQTIERAKELLEALDDEELGFFDAQREGYRLAEVEARYADFAQRWVVVESEGRARRGIEQVERRIAHERTKATKALRELGRRPFNCERDASEAAKKLAKSLRYHRLENITIESEPYHEKPGRPRKEAMPAGYRYRVVAELVGDEAEEVARRKRRAGRFVLATNVMDAQSLGAEEILETYLDQQVVERGFRFLKDPLFFTSSVFLKTPKRIAALAMVMGLCLLVYSLGEREVRLKLARSEASIPDQKGKPTQRPTLRWVFQSLQAVHLVIAGASKLIHGLTEEREHVLRFFSPECRRYYLLM